jgi:hypothetical protein
MSDDAVEIARALVEAGAGAIVAGDDRTANRGSVFAALPQRRVR